MTANAYGDDSRTGKLMATLTAVLEEHRAEIDAGHAFDSLTIVAKFHKSGDLMRVIYRPETVKVL